MHAAEFRIFLSSTFRDLQPEREQLVKKVFPRIRAACRERGVEFTEIDLRWGITAEESRSGKAVRICLDEIGKCAPYFIGILGSRYGWAPGVDELQKDEECLERYPWLREFGEDHKSITEMEITHGAFRSERNDCAFFYEQTSKLGDIPDYEQAPLDSLKHKIRSREFPLRPFNSPEELGEHVYRDILFLLDRDFPADAEPTAVELERAPHIAFSSNRRRSYVANPEYLKRFEQHVESDDIPLIVWGRSGLGKSALMAYLTSEHLKKYPDSFVIMHFIGAAAAGSDPEDVMRQVMMEIKERYSLDDEIPQSDQQIREEFPAWLAKVQNEKLVLAIDALNQLTGVAEELHWLPEFIPPHVRLIVSTTPGHTLEQLRKHQWQELELQPLDVEMRRRIANEYLLLYNKKLALEQLDLIASDPKCESPLFLRTLLEELRVFGRHTALEEHIAQYLESADERDLFSKILARMEGDFGLETVRSILRTIFVSRYGLSQTELLGITKLSQLALSELLLALEYHLMQRSGLYTFFHSYLREAVETRYLATDDDKRAAHRTIAEYWTTRSYSTRRRDEEPWQWQQAEDAERFKQCITDIPMLEMLLDEDRRMELIRFWVVMQERFDVAETYHDAIRAFEAKTETKEHFADLTGKLGNALVAASIYKEAEYQLRTALALQEQLYGDNSLQAVQAMHDLGSLFSYTGNLAEAEVLFKRTFEIRESLLGPTHPETTKSLNDLGVILYSFGRLGEARDCFRDAIQRYQEFYHHDHPEIASTLNNLGSILMLQKEYLGAESSCELSLHMYERLFGQKDISLIPPIINLATIYLESKKWSNAEANYLRALDIGLSVYGNRHNMINRIYMNLGMLSSRMHDYRKALELHRKALAIAILAVGENHFETVNARLSVGLNLFRIGQIAEGKTIIEQNLPILKETLGEHHPMYKRQAEAWNELIRQ